MATSFCRAFNIVKNSAPELRVRVCPSSSKDSRKQKIKIGNRAHDLEGLGDGIAESEAYMRMYKIDSNSP